MKFETERETAYRQSPTQGGSSKKIAINVKKSGQSLVGKTDMGNTSEISSTSLSAMQNDVISRRPRPLQKKNNSVDPPEYSVNQAKAELLAPRYAQKHTRNADSVGNNIIQNMPNSLADEESGPGNNSQTQISFRLIKQEEQQNSSIGSIEDIPSPIKT